MNYISADILVLTHLYRVPTMAKTLLDSTSDTMEKKKQQKKT